MCIWCGDVIVDEQPSRALLGKPEQRCLGGLLDVGFFWRCCAQGHRKGRKSTQEPRARLRGTPTHTGIQTLKRCAYSIANEVLPTPPMP